MRRLYTFTIIFFLCAGAAAQAKTPLSEKSLAEQRELKSVRKEHIEEIERFEAQGELERELSKKRTALWKKEQAKLTQQYRQRRAERLSQIDAEKTKELAARARQKEILAQLEIEESEHKAKLAERKMEVLYGKEASKSDGDSQLAESDPAQKKPFWEKWLEPKEK